MSIYEDSDVEDFSTKEPLPVGCGLITYAIVVALLLLIIWLID